MIAIIGAMDEEVAMLKEKMTEVQVESRACMEFYKGKLEGKDTVVVRSGIGKVNAAMCAQILADRYAPSCIINTGIAGSLKAESALLQAVLFRGISLFLIRIKSSGSVKHFPVCVQRWRERPLLRCAILTVSHS